MLYKLFSRFIVLAILFQCWVVYILVRGQGLSVDASGLFTFLFMFLAVPISHACWRYLMDTQYGEVKSITEQSFRLKVCYYGTEEAIKKKLKKEAFADQGSHCPHVGVAIKHMSGIVFISEHPSTWHDIGRMVYIANQDHVMNNCYTKGYITKDGEFIHQDRSS